MGPACASSVGQVGLPGCAKLFVFQCPTSRASLTSLWRETYPYLLARGHSPGWP